MFSVVVLSLTPIVVTRVAPLGEPENIVAIGDSITRATDVCCWYGDHPSLSWSTGFNPLDGLHSNDAKAGATMADAPAQAATAVSQGADYITILIGANDVCTSSVSTMTTVDSFRASFESTMSRLTSGLPDAKIFVASIPNVRRLWTLFHDSPLARYIWRTHRVCQSALSETSTLDDRRHVNRRTLAFNEVLEDVCGGYALCRFDGYAVFAYLFSAGQVSRLDYFHPNLNGQDALAEITWAASWWG
jgi:lysophospholipase L1-like esterase